MVGIGMDWTLPLPTSSGEKILCCESVRGKAEGIDWRNFKT